MTSQVTDILYLANPSTQPVRDAMTAGLIGQIVTPMQGNRHVDGTAWCADNGCFGKGYPGDDKWIEWLDSLPREGCLFAVAPDVVGDAAATLKRSSPWLRKVRDLGFPVALVAQDGLENLWIPWAAFDVLFVGGTTAWKLGPAARELVTRAKAQGKRVHMGRVNSERRYRYAMAIGCDTVDGTYIAFGPDRNLPHVLAWSRNIDQLTFDGATA